jgi:hypothetical protein
MYSHTRARGGYTYGPQGGILVGGDHDSIKTKREDKIYYNVVIPYRPDSTGFAPAVFQEQLNQSILDRPSDYYMTIIRFSIPVQNIPIFIAEIQPFPNTNLNNTIYSVTLTYGANTSGQTFVQFVTQNPNATPSLPLTAFHPNADKTPYYYIYEYTQFLSMVNATLATAFAALPGSPVGSQAPYFIFDGQRLSLVAQIAYYDQALPTPINIYMNYFLLTYFDGITTDFYGVGLVNGLDAKFLVRNDYNNFYNPPNIAPVYPPLYYIMTQNYTALIDWNSFKSLSLVSNLIPIKQEFIPSSMPNQGFNLAVVNSRGQLKDFEPIFNNNENRTVVQYFPTGPYQLINMNSDDPLTKIDISIFWSDQFGNIYPLDIPFNQLATIKILFTRKDSKII